jgi:hypothetical protein
VRERDPIETSLVVQATSGQGEFAGPQAVRDWWPVLRMLILMAAMTG